MKQRIINRLLLIAVMAILIPQTLHAAPAGPGDWSKVRLFGHAFRNDDYTPGQYDFIRDNYYIFTVEKRHAKNIYGATSTDLLKVGSHVGFPMGWLCDLIMNSN